MHNFPKNVEVVCNKELTTKELKDILKLAIDNDIQLYSSCLSGVDKNYPCIGFDEDKELVLWKNPQEDEGVMIVSLKEFKAFMLGKGNYVEPFREELELNIDYKAVVTKDRVTVGCQKFSHDVVKQLYQISQKALKS